MDMFDGLNLLKTKCQLSCKGCKTLLKLELKTKPMLFKKKELSE